MTFLDRKEAGKALGKELLSYAKNSLVLAIPRGGVPIGYEVAKEISSPLSIIGVRKIGYPWNNELAIGAISEFQTIILDKQSIKENKIPTGEIRLRVREEKKELNRRIALYRPNSLQSLENKNVIIVDDGLATGLSAKAAILAVSKLHPKSVLFATPVCSAEMLQDVLTVVDNVVCIITPSEMQSIGEWYQDFSQVSDDDVISLLQKSQPVPHHQQQRK